MLSRGGIAGREENNGLERPMPSTQSRKIVEQVMVHEKSKRSIFILSSVLGIKPSACDHVVALGWRRCRIDIWAAGC